MKLELDYFYQMYKINKKAYTVEHTNLMTELKKKSNDEKDNLSLIDKYIQTLTNQNKEKLTEDIKTRINCLEIDINQTGSIFISLIGIYLTILPILKDYWEAPEGFVIFFSIALSCLIVFFVFAFFVSKRELILCNLVLRRLNK